MQAPHLTPTYLPVHRVILEAVGHDVQTVIIDGQVVLENRTVKTVSELDILAEAQEEAIRTIEQAGLSDFLKPPKTIWKSPRIILEE